MDAVMSSKFFLLGEHGALALRWDIVSATARRHEQAVASFHKDKYTKLVLAGSR